MILLLACFIQLYVLASANSDTMNQHEAGIVAYPPNYWPRDWRKGEPHLLDHIRITQGCYPPTGWYFRTPNDTGVLWYGTANTVFAAIQDNLPTLEANRNVSKPDFQNHAIMTILHGKADMQAATYGQYWDRFQYVDFSYPIWYSTVQVRSLFHHVSLEFQIYPF